MEQKERVENIQKSQVVRLADISDEALVEKIKQGSEAAFAELTKRYMHKSYSIAYQMVADRETARDLSQDVFVKIYSSVHTFKKGARFFSWFYRILLNHCINYTRRKKTLAFIPFSELFVHSDEESDPSESARGSYDEISDRKRVVHAAINRLPLKHKQVIILCELEGLLQEEAADILNIAVGTVRSRLHYARQELKELLKDYIKEL